LVETEKRQFADLAAAVSHARIMYAHHPHKDTLVGFLVRNTYGLIVYRSTIRDVTAGPP
jgi:hypothetical protein